MICDIFLTVLLLLVDACDTSRSVLHGMRGKICQEFIRGRMNPFVEGRKGE